METSEYRSEPEVKKEKIFWEHHCQSCHLEGSTAFTNRGVSQKMDVYSCSNHTQPGLYGGQVRKIEGDLIVVRYASSSHDVIGEVSYGRNELDINKIKSEANKKDGRPAPAEIAISKVL